MSFDSLLINKATIKRWTDDIADPYGNPTKVAVVPDPYINESCRLSYPKGRQVQRGTEVVPVDAVLFMNEIVVTETDKVEVDGIEFEILFVAQLQDGFGGHHLELSLKRIIP